MTDDNAHKKVWRICLSAPWILILPCSNLFRLCSFSVKSKWTHESCSNYHKQNYYWWNYTINWWVKTIVRATWWLLRLENLINKDLLRSKQAGRESSSRLWLDTSDQILFCRIPIWAEKRWTIKWGHRCVKTNRTRWTLIN